MQLFQIEPEPDQEEEKTGNDPSLLIISEERLTVSLKELIGLIILTLR